MMVVCDHACVLHKTRNTARPRPSPVLAAWVMSAQGTVQGWPIIAFCDSELKLNIPCIAN